MGTLRVNSSVCVLHARTFPPPSETLVKFHHAEQLKSAALDEA